MSCDITENIFKNSSRKKDTEKKQFHEDNSHQKYIN